MIEEQLEEWLHQEAGFIRELCQGPGVMSDEYDEPIREEVLINFGVGDRRGLRTQLEERFQIMPWSKYRAAIAMALGRDFQYRQPTLTERRNAFIADNDEKISYRTLIRHEHEGALALARLRSVAGNRRDMPMNLLVNRVAVLERLVSALVMTSNQEQLVKVFGSDEARIGIMEGSIIQAKTWAEIELDNELKGAAED